jgi:activated CDC42 kinase 1
MTHFDFVQAEDLEKIGMSKPGVRRLLESVKKRKAQLWKKNLFNRLIPTTKNNVAQNKRSSSSAVETSGSSPTCLIQEKVSK